MLHKLKRFWIIFWMRWSGLNFLGRIATRIATLRSPSYKSRHNLAFLYDHGYIAPDAIIFNDNLHLGKNIYVGSRVIIHGRGCGGKVVINDRVAINDYTIIENRDMGNVIIGERTTIQPRCQFSAYKGSIQIGKDVQIGPNCAFYPYNHSFEIGKPINEQPLNTKGGIIIGNNVWLGYGVIVLDNVKIGNGAVIGAGSVVKNNISENSIAAGIPARVIKNRVIVN